jgi:hypothetical protein
MVGQPIVEEVSDESTDYKGLDESAADDSCKSNANVNQASPNLQAIVTPWILLQKGSFTPINLPET